MKYSPAIYEKFKKEFPQVASSFDKLAQDCHEWGPLDKKSRRLVKLGIAIGLGTEGDIQSHALQALDEGLTADELRHAVILSLTTAGFPAMIVAMRWVEDVIASKAK
jgi:alkylhydroperoxidase/carboxymuconolactone decarboxylase family protein YurZ